MMYFSHGDLGWAGWTLMVGSMLLFWGLLIWGVSLLVRQGSGRGHAAPDRAPEQVLAHRFAAGEIDADAYHRALDVLASRSGGTGTGGSRA